MSNSDQHTSAKKVKKRLQSAYRSVLSRQKQMVFFRALFVLLAGLTALIIAEELLYLSAPVKSMLLGGLVIASLFAVWKGFSSNKPISFKAFYRQFSRSSKLPELKDTLDLDKSSEGNRALIDAAILQNLSHIKPERLNNTLNQYLRDSETYTAHKKVLGFCIATLIVFVVTAFNFNNAADRSFSFWENYEKPNPYTFSVEPGNITLEQGSDFEVQVEFHGNQLPDDITLLLKTSVEENFRSRSMESSGNIFKSIPMELNNDLEYYLQMDGYQSKTFTADVQFRPRFSELRTTIIPPAYTQIDTTIRFYPISQLRAYEGSKVKISGLVNKELATAQLISADSTTELSVYQDSTLSHSLEVTGPDTLRFYIEDNNGLSNQNPFQLIISPLKDEHPLVEILEPEDSFQEVNPQQIDLLYRASDDFGLTSSRLHYELSRAYVDLPETGTVNLETPGNGSLEPFSWNLQNFNLKPQDELTFWVTVQDNDRYNGFKNSTSKKITLTIPSMVEYFEDFDEKENEVESDLDEISESFQQTQEQYERFKEKMKDNPENTGYEEKQELDQVRRQQEEVQKKVEELNEKFNQLKDELSKDNMLSEETQQAYEELQKLMEEIDDPEFLEALKKMQEQLGMMSPEQMREAMEEMEFNEELYKERLERTIELFKQLKLSSDLDKLTRSFEDMARKEAERTENEQSPESKKQELEQSLEENEKLKNKVDSLSKNTSPKNQKKVSEYQEETQKELQELMEELQKELENQTGEPNSGEDKSDGDSNDQQQDSNRQERYQQLAKNTQSLLEGMQQQQMNINIAGLQYVLYSLLNLSLEQEDLNMLASSAENRSQAFVSYARDQRNVDEIFSSVSDSLFALSSEIPQFSNQINKKKLEVEDWLERSLNQMSERDRSKASVASREALGGINELSFMIVNLLEQLQGSGGSGGGGGMSMQQMMEQLQQSGQNQRQLNQRLQEMINDIQGERLSQDQMERLNQIAKEQNRIRKQLQELQRSGELDGDRIGSELERMIEDMEDTINDLRGGSTDPMMIERQQNILSRMLNAEKALQEKEEEEDKREGDTPEELRRAESPEMTLEELEKEIRNRLNDPNFTKYSPDYQRLIENYFELLKELQEREIP